MDVKTSTTTQTKPRCCHSFCGWPDKHLAIGELTLSTLLIAVTDLNIGIDLAGVVRELEEFPVNAIKKRPYDIQASRDRIGTKPS
jgi:hypothetical protein